MKTMEKQTGEKFEEFLGEKFEEFLEERFVEFLQELNDIEDRMQKYIWEAEVCIAYECEEELVQKYGPSWYNFFEEEEGEENNEGPSENN